MRKRKFRETATVYVPLRQGCHKPISPGKLIERESIIVLKRVLTCGSFLDSVAHLTDLIGGDLIHAFVEIQELYENVSVCIHTSHGEDLGS